MPGPALGGGTEPLPSKALSLKVLLRLVNTEKPPFQFIPNSPTHLMLNTWDHKTQRNLYSSF